jgi:CrcB protein
LKALALQLSAVALGGAAGSVLRYLLGLAVHSGMGKGFPFGTLAVNVLGSLAIGYLATVLPHSEQPAPLLRLLLITGLLGGFTTFSAFSMETLDLLQAGDTHKAGLNVLATVLLCLLSVWAGFGLARALHGSALP